MRRAGWFWRCAGTVTLSFAAMASPEMAEALSIQFESVDLADTTPGEDLRQLRYHVSGDVNGSLLQAGQGFTIEFAQVLYRALQDPPPPVNADWDVLILQPDPGIPDDGVYDALALGDDPSLADPFVVSFVWLGAGVPGAQPFAVNQFDVAGNLVAVLQVGVTEPLVQAAPVPEPGASMWIGVGFAVLASLRRIRSAGWAR